MNIENEKPTSQDDDKEERRQTFTRRRLLQVGWTVPVIVALEMAQPKTVFASGGGSHIDFTDHRDSPQHKDSSHKDQHKDEYWDHADSHQDGHTDLHDDKHKDKHKDKDASDNLEPNNQNEIVHHDSHTDFHEDILHGDITSYEDYWDHIDN